MSQMMETDQNATACAGDCAGKAVIQKYPAREAELGGGLKIRRALPTRAKRMIGAWCFLDHFGPLDFGQRKAMDVAPHPHIGLQTVTWLLEGEVHHKDSLGYNQVIYPGQLNLMTAGHGISHSEETPPEHSGKVHGVQLWVASPDKDRDCEPRFEHFPEVPMVEQDGMRVQVFVGETLGVSSPATMFTPMVGLDVALLQPGSYRLPLKSEFEHGIMIVEGEARVEDVAIEQSALYDLGQHRDEVVIEVDAPARIIVVGGEPFPEKILMWWNYVARTPEEIDEARQQWANGERFGVVSDYEGDRLPAPDYVARPLGKI